MHRFEITPVADSYQCRLLLPPNAAVREIQSPVVRSKTMSKQLAALMACKELYAKGALNEYLLPVVTGDKKYVSALFSSFCALLFLYELSFCASFCCFGL